MRVATAPLATAAALLACAAGLGGCPNPDEPGPPLPMEIGVRAADGTFRPLADGDTMSVVLGANGLNMVVPSLRAADINPRAPDPAIEVDVGGFAMGADIEGARIDMEDDGAGFVLWDLRVPFQTELCCYVCGQATVIARIRDNSGRSFEGRVTVQLERGGCPDVTACCDTADMCPDPSLTLVCP